MIFFVRALNRHFAAARAKAKLNAPAP